MLSRLEKGGKLCCISTAWSSKDSSRRILEWCKECNISHKHILMKALQDDGTYLCEDLLDEKTYNMKKSIIGEEIFEANYNQVCLDNKGRLYKDFKTYDIQPQFNAIYACADLADKGSDNTVCIVFGIHNMQAYVIDVFYSKDNMTITEPLVAAMLYNNNVNLANMESNNGGFFYAKTVEKTLKEQYHSTYTTIRPFHQSKNKEARILSNSYWVNENIIMPSNWKRRWTKFYEDVSGFLPGESKYDDAPDTLTQISEFVNKHNRNSYNDDVYMRGKGVVSFSDYYDRYQIRNIF